MCSSACQHCHTAPQLQIHYIKLSYAHVTQYKYIQGLCFQSSIYLGAWGYWCLLVPMAHISFKGSSFVNSPVDHLPVSACANSWFFQYTVTYSLRSHADQGYVRQDSERKHADQGYVKVGLSFPPLFSYFIPTTYSSIILSINVHVSVLRISFMY